MDKPWLLDLFAGAGGAGEGYRRAGFHVVSVDIKPQKHNPHEFYQDDAVAVLDALLAGHEWNGYHLHDFLALHASPPCQEYTALHARHPHKSYPDLIAPMRARLQRAGVPWVMENVPPAPLAYWVQLCGTMFGLRVYRHRRFETSWLMWQPAHPQHTASTGSGRGQRQRKAHYLAGGFVCVTGNVGSYAGDAMGIDWMNGAELSQAIPPAYTQWIGQQLLNVVYRVEHEYSHDGL